MGETVVIHVGRRHEVGRAVPAVVSVTCLRWMPSVRGGSMTKVSGQNGAVHIFGFEPHVKRDHRILLLDCDVVMHTHTWQKDLYLGNALTQKKLFSCLLLLTQGPQLRVYASFCIHKPRAKTHKHPHESHELQEIWEEEEEERYFASWTPCTPPSLNPTSLPP